MRQLLYISTSVKNFGDGSICEARKVDMNEELC